MKINTYRPERTAARLETLLSKCPGLEAKLAPAVEAMRESEAQITRLDQAADELSYDEGTAAALVLDALANGSELPDLLTVFDSEREARDRHQYVLEQLTHVKNQLIERANRFASDTWSGIPSALHEVVCDLVDKGRETNDKLKGISTAEAAIAGDKIGEWQKWTQLSDAYRSARDAQRTIAAHGPLEHDYAIAYRNELWLWVGVIEDAEYESPENLRHLNQRVPWATYEGIVRQPELKPWVPTPAEAQQRLYDIERARYALTMSDHQMRSSLDKDQLAYLKATKYSQAQQGHGRLGSGRVSGPGRPRAVALSDEESY